MLCHISAAYNLARWLLGDPNDAEDAVQESTIKAYKAFASHRGEDAKPWYLAIVRNSCTNLLKARNRKQDFEREEDETMPIPDPCDRPDVAMEKAFDAGRLKGAIESLPASWKELVILREFELMSYKELAEVTGTPIGTVMSRLSRARSRLLDLLTEEAHVL